MYIEEQDNEEMAIESLFGFTFGTSVTVDERGIVTITGVNYKELKRFIQKYYKASTFLSKFMIRTWSNSLQIHQFYVPELVYLLTKAVEERYLPSIQTRKVIDQLYEKTWFGDSLKPVESIVDMNAIKTEFIDGFKLQPYQEEFIKETYYQKKTQYHLKGYLLSLFMGGGKSVTSLSLGTALHKRHFVIICPLSTVENVWVGEINKFYKNQKNIWTPKQSELTIKNNTEYLIVNYEAIEKVTPYILKYFDPRNTIFIVDECHNFKDFKSKRTQNLYKLCTESKCEDILLMSGTPIKALGAEVIPILKMLDGYFVSDIETELVKLVRYTAVMNDLLRNRLGMMMYRKLREEVLVLPEKHEEELRIKIPNGDYYTLDNVKKLVDEFTKERTKFYSAKYKEFEQVYKDCLKEFETTLVTREDWIAYKEYLNNVIIIQKTGFGRENLPFIVAANRYEKDVIIPNLPVKMRADFRAAKSVVKYVELKILGEVLGSLLNDLRTEMTTELIGKEVIEIIQNAAKKTILFSSYVDTIQIADEYCRKHNLNPLVITGDNTKIASQLLTKFKTDESLNPLIASIKAMSTGHTIIEANTVIFLNVPFRSVDYEQASDRVYRIGQDTEVYIYKLVLDTGSKPNLSTRMQDIIAWSKESFNTIVGDDIDDNTVIDTTDVKSHIKNFINNGFITKTDSKNLSSVIDSVISKFVSFIKRK